MAAQQPRFHPHLTSVSPISVGHAYTSKMIDLLADQAPGLLKGLRENNPEYVLLDGTLTECDRTGSRANYSAKYHRHGVNVQIITDPTATFCGSRPHSGRCHDLTAARTHRIIRICERQACPSSPTGDTKVPAPWVTVCLKQPPGGELTPTQHTVNYALATAWAPIERGMARLKTWRIFRRSRSSPNRMMSIANAVLTLEHQR